MYNETTNDYIAKGYVRQLSKSEVKSTSPKTSYLPHHGFANINKPDRLRVGFDAATTYSAILDHFYMDDYFDSFPSLEQAISVIVDVIQLLKLGGFNLTKFVSNNLEILKYTTRELPSKNKLVNLDLNQTSIEQTLGIFWDPEQEVLRIKVINKKVPNTKRGILSFVSSIFDLLGILTPALIEPKCIIQDLWKQNIDWDHPIRLDILDRWQKWKNTLDSLRTIEIPR